MTKKSFTKILSFGIGILFISTLITVLVFHSHYEKQAEKNLSDTASIIACQLNTNDDYSFIGNDFGDTRITLISSDGEVLADSEKTVDNMENHSDRPEFIDALQSGNGSTVRKSATLDKDTYYYAVRLDSGDVLRVSITSQSVYVVFYHSLLILAAIMICIILAAFAVSVAITKSIVKPITHMGEHLDDIEKINEYTELQPFVEAIKSQQDKQRLLDRQKKEFTANVSHELKTPLTSIAGYAELIENGIAKQEDIKPFAHTIRTQALRLVGLTEDIIQLSQLDEVEDEITFEEVDLYELSQKCMNALTVNAKAKNVTISIDGEESIIKGNRALIEELIYNLIDNAIRYNKENGSVKISAKYTKEKSILTVSDTGIGIPDKYKKRVFERFFRVDKSRSKQTGGTGLGLAIVKHIAEIHNAVIDISSKEDIGTEIKIIFKSI